MLSLNFFSAVLLCKNVLYFIGVVSVVNGIVLLKFSLTEMS